MFVETGTGYSQTVVVVVFCCWFLDSGVLDVALVRVRSVR